MTFRAVIVDDEALAIERLSDMLSDDDRVTVVGSASTVEQAVDEIDRLGPDLIFLDIRLGHGTGFDVLRSLKSNPWVVFTTAYAAHALEAFNHLSIDYLLKPLEEEALDRALNKAMDVVGRGVVPAPILQKLEVALGASSTFAERLASKIGRRTVLIGVREVLYIQAEEKLVYAHMESGAKRVLDETLTELEDKLNPQLFTRIHRSMLVNVERIGELRSDPDAGLEVVLTDADTTCLKVSRGMAPRLRAALNL